MEKAQLREMSLKKRSVITNRPFKDLQIFSKFIHLPEFESAKNLLIYINIGEEAETRRLIDFAINRSKTVYIPYTEEQKIGIFKGWEKLSEVELNEKKFLQPNEESPDIVIDCAIIPIVGFDKKLNRLGYGKGWYDRFLKKNKNCFKIGIAYDEQLISKIPTERHDVPMNMIITPNNLYK